MIWDSPLLIVDLLLTVVKYGAFPVLFVKFRKKEITKSKFNILCYCVNGVLFVSAFFVYGMLGLLSPGPYAGGPYLLWTMIFTWRGTKKLAEKGILKNIDTENDTQ